MLVSGYGWAATISRGVVGTVAPARRPDARGRTPVAMLRIVPLELKELNTLVERLHRHHKRVQGHRFSIGVVDHRSGQIVGGASVGRPTARLTNQKEVLEVTRLVTDGTPHACSALYAAAARIGRELGYRRIQTFILVSEPGTSLVAAGWKQDDDAKDKGLTRGGTWERASKPNRRHDQPECPKRRFIKQLTREDGPR